MDIIQSVHSIDSIIQATLGCLSRLVSRSLVSGVANAGGNCKESAANQVRIVKHHDLLIPME